MVKQLNQKTNGCISLDKRVSFKPDCRSKDYFSQAEEEGIGDDSGVLPRGQDDDIERLLKVMQSLNVARLDSVERFSEISKMLNTERCEIFEEHRSIASDVNLHKHKTDCLEASKRFAKSTDSYQKDVGPVELAKEVSPSPRAPLVDCFKHPTSLDPVVIPTTRSAVDDVKCLGEVDRNPSVLRFSSVDGLTDDDTRSSTTEDTGSGSSSRRGSGDSLQGPCRGYSSQRRHGRKDSLGTVDFTRLIPTLVSDNEEFRHKEYQRQISVQSIELQHSTW